MLKKIQNSKIFNSIYISASTLPQPPFCIAGQSYKTFLVNNLLFGEKNWRVPIWETTLPSSSKLYK